MPRCKNPNCRDKFTAIYFLQKYCMLKDECIKEFNESVKTASKKKDDKIWKERKKVMKENLMNLSDWFERLQTYINKIARLIDKNKNCMMHGKPIKKAFGCHFHSVGGNGTLRFHLLNIWVGCFSCNGMQGGNLPGYEKEILKEFGDDALQTIKYDIVRNNPYLGLEKVDVKELIPIATSIIKELESLDLEYSNAMRWKLRLKYNELLNIYQ